MRVVERVLSVRTRQVRGDPFEITPRDDAHRVSPRTPPGGRTTLLVDRVGRTEVRVEDLPVANDVPLRQHGEPTLGEPRRLDIGLHVGFEVVGELPQELVGYEESRRKPRASARGGCQRMWLLDSY